MKGKEPINASAIESAWEALRNHDSIYDDVRGTVKRAINEECTRQINAGNYDCAASLRVVYDVFARKHLFDEAHIEGGCPDIEQLTADVDRLLVDEQPKLVDAANDEQREKLDNGEPFVDVVLTEELVFETAQFGWNEVAKAIFQRVIEQLEQENELLYVYNRQQVRSHVAETARYFALMRQRLGSDSPYEYAPSLVKMVKLASADREQPIIKRGAEESARLQSPISQLDERLLSDGVDVTPAWELADAMGDNWQDAVAEALDAFETFLNHGLSEEFDALAGYQARAFRDLYIDAVTENEERSHVVTASTGGGKTEAFLFPILMYCVTADAAGIDGSTAVLTYPRRDLCDNQFERAFEYITEINRLRGSLDRDFNESSITISLQHSTRNDVELECPHCDAKLTPVDDWRESHFSCSGPQSHEIRYATTGRADPADIVITTQSSLHRRILDKYGRQAFWEQSYPPKFLVLDEVHIYSDQAGMNVANLVRRFKQALDYAGHEQSPTLVASSATIEAEEEFTNRIFGTDTAEHIHPHEEEKRTTSREHFVFVKATDPREVQVPTGDSVFKPREDWDPDEVVSTTATNLSCMIQIAFGFQHTMRKETVEKGGSTVDKNRLLGFVDSIDSVSRLAGYVQEAEDEGLFELRQPDALLGTRDNNPDCPRERFREATDDEYSEEAVCDSLPPNPNHTKCEVYEHGECWWTMGDGGIDLQRLRIAKHKSGGTVRADGTGLTEDEWDMLISTSALEVGFDHESVIGTFQYRAPRNVPGFIQRKGRGGRDADDEPITVVVLGSSPTDAYYFHHSNILSDPSDEHLEIPLDEKNRFVRASHMTSAILDYFNVRNDVDADRIFTGKSNTGPDVDYLRTQFYDHRPELKQWLTGAFKSEDDPDLDAEIDDVLAEFEAYLEKLNQPVAPGENDTPFWEFFGEALDGGADTGSYGPLDELIQSYQDGVE